MGIKRVARTATDADGKFRLSYHPPSVREEAAPALRQVVLKVFQGQQLLDIVDGTPEWSIGEEPKQPLALEVAPATGPRAVSGAVRHLDRDAFTVEVTDRWTSPATGADYPAAWTIRIPGDDLTILLRPTVADQELDTRATTGVISWEGSQVVTATRGGVQLGGEAYVELTGYGGVAAE